MRLPDKITLKPGCRVVLRRNLQITQGWVNGALCEVLDMTQNCILVCKLGNPKNMYPIARTKQRIDIKGASYSILRSQFPVQLAYAVTVHRVLGLTVDSAILNNNVCASGQAYIALSRVSNLDDLTLWDFTPSAIKIAPYYKQLLEWCDSVDVIRPESYDGPPVRYPDRKHDDISCVTVDDDIEAILDIIYQTCEGTTMCHTNKQQRSHQRVTLLKVTVKQRWPRKNQELQSIKEVIEKLKERLNQKLKSPFRTCLPGREPMYQTKAQEVKRKLKLVQSLMLRAS